MGKHQALIQKVSIIIPVFNEGNTVFELLSQVFRQELPFSLKKEIIIIESNSSDDSRKICQEFVNDNKDKGVEFQLLLQEKAMGKGFATRAGLKKVTGDIVLIQDADLEYDVKDYPLLLEPIYKGHTQFVLGSRHLSAGSWKIRHFEESTFKSYVLNFGGWLFHTLFNVLYGVSLTDPTTMYKVFRSHCLKDVRLESNRFDFDFEMVAKLIRLGYTPLEVPVSYNSRGFEEGKKVTMFRDPLTWVRAIIKYRFVRIQRLTAAELAQHATSY